MLPSQTQRMLMLLAVLVGLPAWGWAAGRLLPADGLDSWTLMDAGPGLALAVVIVVAALLPSVLASVVLAAAGNPLTGLLSGLVSVAFTAWHLGFIEVARRAVDAERGDGLYLKLASELGVWFGLLAGWLLILHWAGPRLRPKLPARLRSRHVGERLKLIHVDGRSIAAGLVTAAVGGVLSVGLLRSSDPGQVVGGLILAFMIAALVGHSVSPGRKPWAVLAAPGVVGLAGYGVAWWAVGRGSGDTLLAMLYAGNLPGAGLGAALPIHYVTAGVIGCTIGLGIGLVVDRAKVGEL